MSRSRVPGHLTDSLLARIGAGRPLRQAYDEDKWARGELGPEVARWFGHELRTNVDFHAPHDQRITQAKESLARLADELTWWESRPRSSPRAPRRQPQKRLPRPAIQHMVYLLYDADNVLLYVGITDRGPKRLVEHARNKVWFNDVYRVEFEHCANRQCAAEREQFLIQRLLPLYNITHNTEAFVLVHHDRHPRRAP